MVRSRKTYSPYPGPETRIEKVMAIKTFPFSSPEYAGGYGERECRRKSSYGPIPRNARGKMNWNFHWNEQV